ncbi:dCTP deaminase domain-containing protein, partial [Clostridium perfringens]
EKNLKENSINLSASKYAWSMKKGKVFSDKEGNLYNENKNNNLREINIYRGKNSVKRIGKKEYIILLPSSTTLIETKEVIAIDNYIGGTYHSKVGIVSLGIGHIGTMVGPNFCGHSLIAIHNVSDYPLKIDIEDTVVSVIFYYLKTPINSSNATQNGHLDKMSTLGIKLSDDELKVINEDWKRDIVKIREKMNSSLEFKNYKKKILKRKLESFKSYISIRNILSWGLGLGILVFAFKICKYIDINNGDITVWRDRFWNVGLSGVLVVILQQVFKFSNSKR